MTPGQGLDTLFEANLHRVTQEFEGLDAFAAHLVAVAALQKLANREALKEAGKIITADARAQIGHYQEAHGNYPEWAELAESTEDEKARLGAPPDAPLERFGGLKKSFRSELEGDDTVIAGSTDPVMEYHEFGTTKMPPRPVLGPALYKNLEKIGQLLAFRSVEALVSGQRLGYRFSAGHGGIAQPDEDATP